MSDIHNGKNDSKLEMDPQQNHPIMGPHLPEDPPPYPETYPSVPNIYPFAPAIYPHVPSTYPSVPSTYPSVPSTYPPVPITYPPVPSTYPPATGTHPSVPTAYPSIPGTYPVMSSVQSIPTDHLEKDAALTVCSHCHNQVVTSVNSSLNGCGIKWLIYSICCCIPFAFFIMCLDHFKTWRHSCPLCQNIIANFTPKASGGTTCGLAFAVIVNLILVLLYIMDQGKIL